jgi:hypothetical protein
LTWDSSVPTVLASGPSVRSRFVHPDTRPYWSPAQPSKKKGKATKKPDPEEEGEEGLDKEEEEQPAATKRATGRREKKKMCNG